MNFTCNGICTCHMAARQPTLLVHALASVSEAGLVNSRWFFGTGNPHWKMHYGSVEWQKPRLELRTCNAFDYYIYTEVISGLVIRKELAWLERINVLLGETMCCQERQCVTRRDSVSPWETMCLQERQCVSRRDSESQEETMYSQERQCGTRRDNAPPTSLT